MVINEKILKFKARSDRLLNQFYLDNPGIGRFKSLGFTDSKVQERMMRLGVEATALGVKDDVDEIFTVATITLQDDFLRQRGVNVFKNGIYS
jgi:hypothetical protein